MTLFVLALFVWFALSVPATLFIGRIIAASTRHTGAPVPPPVGASAGHGLLPR